MRHILTIAFLISLHASGQLRTLDQLLPDGGTTGQFLKKNSATDWDIVWATLAGGGDMLAANNLSEVNPATARTNLGGTAIGVNLFTLSNPGAIRFPRFNADNTITHRTAAEFLSDIGAQASGSYATGTGTANGTNTGDQTSIVGITGTTAQFNTALTDGDFSTGGGTATGTNTGDNAVNSTSQPVDADLTTIAGLTATTDNFLVSVSSLWASRTPAQVKTTLAINLVENTALSTWVGTSNITTLGTIGTGTWNATTIGVSKGGTGLTALGTGLQILRTNAGATAMEWVDPPTGGTGDMLAENNLSDVLNVGTSRTNLGVPAAASPVLTGTATIATANFSGLITTATGTTSLAAINIPAGTVKTTVADGDIEADANVLYGTTDAGNRGYIPIKHFIRCDAARTLPNDANTNAIFNSPTNGRITLETGTYLFESLILVTNMSATSGNAFINLLGAGTATVAAWMWRQSAIDAVAAGTLLDDDVQFVVTSTSVVTTGTTGTVFRIYMKGTFEVTVAGTFIPSIDLVTAAAASVNIGSYFTCERIGSTTLTNIGQWD